MKKNLFFLISISCLVVLSCSVGKQISGDNVWTAVKSADGSEPVQRHEAAFVEAAGKFCLLGGRGIRSASIYDPETGVWTEGAPPPIEIHHFQGVSYQDKVYIGGALTGKYPAETPIPNFYIYDPLADRWTEGPEIPADRRRGSAGVVVYKNKIYLVCGIKDGHRGDHKKWFDVYDPATNTWSQLPDAPRERDHFQASVLKDKLYVIGGRLSMAPTKTFSETIGEVDVYDFKTGRWSTLDQPLPTQRAGSYNFTWGHEVVVLGGESASQETAHAEAEALDVRTNVWRSLPKMIEGRHGSSAIVYQNAVYVASGSGNRGGGPELKTLEKFDFK